MPEWLIERGIGETRAALVDDGYIVEARIELENSVPAGTVLEARLTSVGQNGQNAVACDAQGTEHLLPRGAPGVTEGASLNVEVTREAIPGAEPWKRPTGRATEAPALTLAPLEERLCGRLLILPGGRDELAEDGWNDLIAEAASGTIQFSGCELQLFLTPAMTLIDVDGPWPPVELTIGGALEAAQAIRRLDIGGNIGIDLPTTRERSARTSAVDLVDRVLAGTRFERTAVNGFGFLQIIRPRLRPSLLELAQDRASFEARALLRRAAFEPAGSKRLVVHPAVASVLEHKPDWIEALSRQVGGAISLRADAGLPMSGGYAETA